MDGWTTRTFKKVEYANQSKSNYEAEKIKTIPICHSQSLTFSKRKKNVTLTHRLRVACSFSLHRTTLRTVGLLLCPSFRAGFGDIPYFCLNHFVIATTFSSLSRHASFPQLLHPESKMSHLKLFLISTFLLFLSCIHPALTPPPHPSLARSFLASLS